VLLVLLCINLLLGLIGGAGVAFGAAAAGHLAGGPTHLMIAGGAFGGMIVGAVVEVLGLDGFNLLLGQSLGDITGAFEGLLLGAAVGFGAWIATREGSGNPLSRRLAPAAIAGGVAGILITLSGGRLMGGSLALLAERFPGSRLRLDRLTGVFGEQGFGPVTQGITGALEGAVFAVGVVAAMAIVARGLDGGRSGEEPGAPRPNDQ
jgi:hypothetical protein